MNKGILDIKIYYLKKYHPDIALFVQTSPAFSCPSLITEAMASRIEKVTHTPIVAITYDGTGGNKNEVIIPYLAFPRREKQAPPREVQSVFIPWD
jgi:hypothetical protein